MNDMPTADNPKRLLSSIAPATVSAGLLLLVGVAIPLPMVEAASFVSAATNGLSTADSTRKYRYLAKTARERKEHAKALEYYRLLLRYDPDYAKGHYFRGKILAEQKDYAGAKESLLAAVALDSALTNGNALLCQLLLAEGKPDSSQRYLNRIRDLKGGRFRALQRRVADALRREGLTKAAISQYEDLAAADSLQAGKLHDLLATLYQDLGQSSKALSWRARQLAHLEQVAPGTTDVMIETLQEMVLLQQQTGAHDEALATLGRLAQMDAGNSYPYYRQMAEIAEQTHKPAVVKKALEGMARANPKDVESAAVLAELYLTQDELEVAEQWIDRGLSIVPANAHLQVLKGDIMSRRGLEDEAIDAFEIAREDPDWRTVAQQRIWQLRPPETEEEKLKRAFFGDDGTEQ